MILDSIKNLVRDDFEAVNQLIQNNLTSDVELINQLCRHILDSGGKRLRPLMVILSSKACGYSGDKHIKLAAAIEYFHTATLLHDDVVDESALRRGKETANKIWGSKACILVGDYLFTHSVDLIVSSRNWGILDLFAGISHQISCGEIKQLQNRYSADIKAEDYFDVIRSKTSLLFSASAELGARLAESSPALNKALSHYGLHLGNAFQLVDDALDYSSSPEILGKNIGDDLADGKITLPLICAIERGTPEQAAVIRKSIQHGAAEQLDDILQIVIETKALDYTYKIACQEVNLALSSLGELKDSVYKKALIDLAHFAVSRQH